MPDALSFAKCPCTKSDVRDVCKMAYAAYLYIFGNAQVGLEKGGHRSVESSSFLFSLDEWKKLQSGKTHTRKSLFFLSDKRNGKWILGATKKLYERVCPSYFGVLKSMPRTFCVNILSHLRPKRPRHVSADLRHISPDTYAYVSPSHCSWAVSISHQVDRFMNRN